MGHAINKILKDITIRSKVIRGQRVHYVPGWDCHGLPIELKALNSMDNTEKNLAPLQIRQQARNFAKNAIVKQREVFSSWGVMADWKETGSYFTNQTSYVTNQLRLFQQLYEKGLIFKDFKPVHWSPSSRTALAEAELEYNNFHKSTCATVRVAVCDLPLALQSFQGRRVFALTWTTTPWTLLANQALAYHSDINYCIAEDAQGNLNIVAEDRLNSLIEKIGPLKKVASMTGNELAGAMYLHPISGNPLPFLHGSHVTTTLGTGLVHTAPAHGSEDFLVALENNIPVISLVDESGRYTSEAGGEFAGLFVLTEGSETVLKHISDNVLHTEIIEHSYPYDWRTKKPIIMRASQQWFIDTAAIKQDALNSLTGVKIYPEVSSQSSRTALLGQVEKRPYWCISRQRVWGTPIPVLYNKDTGDVVTNRVWVERLCSLIEKQGPDCWWQLPIEKLAGHQLLEDLKLDGSQLERGQDILDIWFDSGISWSTVLPEKQADLCLEGIDQLTGWFQSSLLTSVALQGRPPYKALFIHGFAVDEKSHKMSKSIGNVVNPEEVTRGGKDLKKKPAFGVDTLRWWVASHGSQHSQVPVGNNLLSGSADDVQKLRLILRFLLAALHPYTSSSAVEPQYLYLDKFMLDRLYHYDKKVMKFYDEYQYHHVCKTILHFVTNDVSAVFCHLIKYRLYCEALTSPYRAGTVDVIGEILAVLARSIAPILPHLAEEVWLHHPENLSSVPLFHSSHKIPESWKQPQVVKVIDAALRLKAELNKENKVNTWQLAATAIVDSNDYSLLSVLQNEKQSSVSELCDILQVSSLVLVEGKEKGITVETEPTNKSLCQRCRRHPESEPGEPCTRCAKILAVNNGL
ncbi:isoleucine--tRNA ligase, mitochondrial isoform X2 [Cephus cinctus]|nr:isoleucine--tRNA ligase, mitochondrial isoform X2 [Cephus cinctus]